MWNITGAFGRKKYTTIKATNMDEAAHAVVGIAGDIIIDAGLVGARALGVAIFVGGAAVEAGAGHRITSLPGGGAVARTLGPTAWVTIL